MCARSSLLRNRYQMKSPRYESCRNGDNDGIQMDAFIDSGKWASPAFVLDGRQYCFRVLRCFRKTLGGSASKNRNCRVDRNDDGGCSSDERVPPLCSGGWESMPSPPAQRKRQRRPYFCRQKIRYRKWRHEQSKLMLRARITFRSDSI